MDESDLIVDQVKVEDVKFGLGEDYEEESSSSDEASDSFKSNSYDNESEVEKKPKKNLNELFQFKQDVVSMWQIKTRSG